MKNIKFLSLMLVCLAFSANAFAYNGSKSIYVKEKVETVEQWVTKNCSNFKEENLLLWNSIGKFGKWLAGDGNIRIMTTNIFIAKAHFIHTATKATWNYLESHPEKGLELSNPFDTYYTEICKILTKQLVTDKNKQQRLATRMIRDVYDEDIRWAIPLINTRLEKLKKSSSK